MQLDLNEYGGLPSGETLTWYEEADLPEPPPYLCEKCGNVVVGGGSDTRDCRAGRCTILFCDNCGFEWASWGPIDCWCRGDEQWRDPELRRIRQLYRSRKRR